MTPQNTKLSDKVDINTELLAKCKNCGEILSSDPHWCNLTHEQLIKALYWVWDGFDRALMGMFPVYSTAEDILQNKKLKGDSVHVGVRNAEWTAGSKTILDAFLNTPIEKTKTYNKYIYEDVPVYIHIYEEDPCIINTNQILYENEYFKLPNTYSQFMDRFGKTWK